MIPDLSGGALAQLVEHLTFNQVVGRSSRPRPTTFSCQINRLTDYKLTIVCLNMISAGILPDFSLQTFSTASISSSNSGAE
jgi:hypothetical protein